MVLDRIPGEVCISDTLTSHIFAPISVNPNIIRHSVVIEWIVK